MATTTENTTSSLQTFQAKAKAQVEEAKVKVDQVRGKAKDKRTDAEAAAIAKLNTAKQEIDRKLDDLKSAHHTHVSRAKTEIEADVAKFRASADEFATKFKSGKK